MEENKEAEFVSNSLIKAMPIMSVWLEGRYGFELSIDYCKEFEKDDFYSIRTNTYKKTIVGNLSVSVTDSFKFIEAPDNFKYSNTIVEIVQGTEFQEVKIDKMWQLLMLINMLQGKDADGL